MEWGWCRFGCDGLCLFGCLDAVTFLLVDVVQCFGAVLVAAKRRWLRWSGFVEFFLSLSGFCFGFFSWCKRVSEYLWDACSCYGAFGVRREMHAVVPYWYQSKAGTVTYQKIMPHANSDGSAMTLTIFCVEVKGLKSWRPQSSHGWTESCQADWCVARPYPYGCAYGVGLLLIKWCFVGSGGLILSLVCVGRVSCLSC